MLGSNFYRDLYQFQQKFGGNNMADTTTTTTTTKTTAADYQYMFDAYIDIFPLSWNVHFYPQALYCNGLFLDLLDEYDFIGTYCTYLFCVSVCVCRSHLSLYIYSIYM